MSKPDGEFATLLKRMAAGEHLTATDHPAALPIGSARWPVAHTAPEGVSTAKTLTADG